MQPIIGIVSRPGIIFNKYDVEVTEGIYKNAILACGGIPITILPTQQIFYNSLKPSNIPLLNEKEKLQLIK